MTKYSDLLKNPRWQKKRLEIMQRDNFTCQLCSDTEETLHVHHHKYECKTPWEACNDDLITYCSGCHKVVEVVKLMPNSKLKGIEKGKYFRGKPDHLFCCIEKDGEIDIHIVKIVDDQLFFMDCIDLNFINKLIKLIES